MRPPFEEAFCEALNALVPGWRVKGNRVLGPADTELRFVEHHPSDSDAHTDLEIVLGTRWTLSDCVAGGGETPEERARSAARIWVATTGSVVLEIKCSLRGEHAVTSAATSRAGIPSGTRFKVMRWRMARIKQAKA